jgi:hypothetical protein
LLDIGQTDRLLGLTHIHKHAHIYGPQTSDRFTSMWQNILSDSETVSGKWQADLIKLTHGLIWKTHSFDSTGILANWQNSIFTIYIRNVV